MLIEKLCEKKNIPLYTIFELTYRCNLQCIHCYIKKDSKKELNFYQIKSILNQISSMGTLFITFTGGEVFVRKDFFKILNYATNKGFAINIFTNATLLDKQKVYELKKFNISEMGISLYSLRDEIHDYITGVRGSLKKTLKGIYILKERGFNIKVKCPLMKVNYSDYSQIIDFCNRLKIKYLFDPVIVPYNDGDKSILSLRLDKTQIEKIIRDIRIVKRYKIKKGFLKSNVLCSAGKNFCSISPYGDVYPCIQLLISAGNLKESKFKKIWNHSKVLKNIREIKMGNLKICKNCDIIYYCNRCPGLAHLEDGNLYGPSKIACEIAKIRKNL
jgi:radical SAM protein with 4Fe4S-binding SPASM domain